MIGLHHSPLIGTIKKYLDKCTPEQTVFLYVPYVKTSVLAEMIPDIKGSVVIVTTWEPADILSGSSDLELYPFCKEHGFTLYVSKGLHLKIYSMDLTSCILATGNISRNGLLPGGNHEAAVMVDHLTVDDRLFLTGILRSARLVDDKVHMDLMTWCEKNMRETSEIPSFDDIVAEPTCDDFSVASLPMTRSVDELVLGYTRMSQGLEPSDDAETAACILHDLANYGIGTGMPKQVFVMALTRRFFAHPFINKIDEFINPEAYFGRIKEWIQDNCTDVPVPSRREITGNVQVLLEWFVNLGEGKYVIDVPGRHSQRIRKINS